MNGADLKVIVAEGVPLLVPADELSRYESLALSDRAKRTKLIAGYRPDVNCQQNNMNFYSYVRGEKMYTLKIDGSNQNISESTISPPSLHIHPATPLGKLVADADQQVLTMRKLVQ